MVFEVGEYCSFGVKFVGLFEYGGEEGLFERVWV